MRSRNIKPGFFKNEYLAECPFEARLLYAGLWCIADREGRLEYRPKRIRAELFPFDEVDVETLVQVLCKYGFVRMYTVGGEAFLDIPAFLRNQNPHVNEKPSDIEPYERRDICSENADSSASTVQAPCEHNSDVVQVGLIPDSCNLNPDSLPEAKAPASPPVILLPTNRKDIEYHVTVKLFDEMRELYPGVDAMYEFKRMRGWLLANNKKRKTVSGMPRFINSWLSREQDKNRDSAPKIRPLGPSLEERERMGMREQPL